MKAVSGVDREGSGRGGIWLLVLVLVAVLSVLFLRSYNPGMALHSNDGPLGAQMNKSFGLPGSYLGIWNNLFWLGTYAGSFSPNFTGALLLLGPHGYINFGAPVALLLLGVSAWLFFRTLQFHPAVCILGGVAMALNGNFFSNACWGLISRALCQAAVFLALAAVRSSARGQPIIKLILAGLAIGLSITEGGDNGAIFSLFVAAFALWQIFLGEEPGPRKVARGVGSVALMAVCAGLLAAQSLDVFTSLALKNVSSVRQELQSKAERWSWATQWSLCKAETLRVLIPGLFGYRLDTLGGGNYWGRVGQTPDWGEKHGDPEWERQHPGALSRHSGAGEYAGVLVVLVAAWGLVFSSRKAGGVYSEGERKMIWFWGVMALVALVLSWGRFAPFYRGLYILPYFSTIRSPMKFMHAFHMALVVLFAYGLQGLARCYLDAGATRPAKGWEKGWDYGAAALFAVSLVGWMIYGASREKLSEYILGMLPKDQADAGLALAMARFSINEAGLAGIFVAACLGALLLIRSGVWSGRRSQWAMGVLGLLLVVDLGRANLPWIRYDVVADKYASNPVIDVLRQAPQLARVSAPPLLFRVPDQAAAFQEYFLQAYHVQWLQYNFQYHNIQALEVSQLPREIDHYLPYNRALGGQPGRLWQLTNTRYLLTLAGLAEAFNAQFDPQLRRFRIHTPFQLNEGPSRTYTAAVNSNGPLALIEFAGALPRARLYSRWQVETNDDATLRQLGAPDFDPLRTVLVSQPVPAPAGVAAEAEPGPVEFVNYAPRRAELRTSAPSPTVLLFNERYDPSWRVLVDGVEAPLLRCNYVMRGTPLSPGPHTVVFQYRPKVGAFLVTLASVVAGLLLCGWLYVSKAR